MKKEKSRLVLYIIIFVLAVGSFFVALKDIKPEQTHITKTISAE